VDYYVHYYVPDYVHYYVPDYVHYYVPDYDEKQLMLFYIPVIHDLF
jgi:hypothetical protein